MRLWPIGAGGSIDTDKDHRSGDGLHRRFEGLMYELTLEGSKISHIYR